MRLTRRNFLAASAATLAPLSFSRLSAVGDDAQPEFGMQLGLVTYNWGKDWDLPTLIKNCAEAKFSGVELRTTHKHGVEPTLNAAQREEVRQRFDDSPVKLAGMGSACEYHSPDPAEVRRNIEETKAFIKLSHDCGGSGVKVRPNGLPKEVPVEKTLEQIGLSLREVADFGEGYGQQIRLEVHGFGSAEIPHIHRMISVADHPNALVCWNCNKSDMDGEGLAHNFQLLADKIATVHLHDLRDREIYPWEELFGLLKGIDFGGWTMIEDGRMPPDIVQAMRENRTEWEKLARLPNSK